MRVRLFIALGTAALERGLRIMYLTDEPWGVRRFFVTDPNGVVINVLGHERDPHGAKTGVDGAGPIHTK
jgi:hypothetical protein